MTCPYARHVSDALENAPEKAPEKALPAAVAAQFDAHLRDCAECAAAMADIREIAAVAATLTAHQPPAEVWTRIAREIGTEAASGPTHRPVWGTTWHGLAAAASLAALAFGGTWLASRLAALAPGQVTIVADGGIDDQSIDAPLRLAEEHYATTIVGLEAMTVAEYGALDEQTVDVLQTNLAVIDTAIGESRSALATQPGNGVAQESLLSALESKVRLLEDTVAIINDTRNIDGESADAPRTEP